VIGQSCSTPLVCDEPESKAKRLQAGIDDRAALGRSAHHRRPDEKARLEGLGRLAVAVAIMPIIGVHEDVGAALEFGVDPARRLELEAAGAGPGYRRAVDAMARQQLTGARGLVDRCGRSSDAPRPITRRSRPLTEAPEIAIGRWEPNPPRAIRNRCITLTPNRILYLSGIARSSHRYSKWLSPTFRR
jgi:hypothetical protein